MLIKDGCISAQANKSLSAIWTSGMMPLQVYDIIVLTDDIHSLSMLSMLQYDCNTFLRVLVSAPVMLLLLLAFSISACYTY